MVEALESDLHIDFKTAYGDPNGMPFQTFDPGVYRVPQMKQRILPNGSEAKSGVKKHSIRYRPVDTENCMENSELESGLCRWKTSSGRVRDEKF